MAPKKKNFLAGFADALGQVAGAVGEVVSSAGELLVDADLRRKGVNFIAKEASRGINEAQRGLEASADALGRSIQQGAKARFGAGARQLQSVLRNIERQVQEFQRQQQQRDLQSEIEHHHKLPVDIQIGDQVFEDMPQEMRSRFWYVLLERPELAQQLLKRSPSANHVAAAAGQLSPPDSSIQHSSSQQQQAVQEQGSHLAAAADSTVDRLRPSDHELLQSPSAAAGQADQSALGSPFAAFSSSSAATQAQAAGQTPLQEHTKAPGSAALPPPAAAAAAGSAQSLQVAGATQDSIPDIDDLMLQPSGSGARNAASGAALGSGTDSPGAAAFAAVPAAAAVAGGGGGSVSRSASGSAGWNSAAATAAAKAEAAAAAVLPRAPSPWTSGHNETSAEPPVGAAAAAAAAAAVAGTAVDTEGICCPLAPSPWKSSSNGAAATDASPAVADRVANGHSSSTGTAAARADGDTDGSTAAAGQPSLSADGEGWELVSRDVPSVKADSTGDLEALDTVRTLVESMADEATLDDQRATKQAVFQAMLEVPWVAGEGIPDSPADGTQYAELLAAGCGSVEEVISRDVPRTFPEHPLFNTPAGQQKLLRVLKAYAAADPEVGYCQGMAFAAGVLLMYMPEEPAFRLFQRLMSPEGPNLRRYYLPGLEHLKLELSCFELLLSSHQPLLHQHLLDAGLPAVLYAAQWLMTTYACPFPIHVAARVLDVLLQSDSDGMLPRLGLAVMEALSSHLLELNDFEEVITYLKVKPLSWPLHMHRKVFTAALTSTATDAELAAATVAAREEFLRSGRAASFSSKHLARQATVGGTTRHELVPGPMGPRTLTATEAAAAMAVAAVDDSDGGVAASPAHVGSADGGTAWKGACSSSSSSSVMQQQEQQQRQMSGRQSSSHDGVLVGPVGSGIVVDDMDGLEDLITDLDLLLPGGVSDTDSLSEMGSPEPSKRPQQHASH